ncbi:hypothetical protein [Glaciecola sp. 1036]
MADHGNFKEAFNWWYFLGILLALLAFPLMHIVAGIWVFFLSK